MLFQYKLVFLDLFLEITVLLIFSMIGGRLQLLFEVVANQLVFVLVLVLIFDTVSLVWVGLIAL